MKLPTAERADIGLLLEGTFPYISGGVSSWVNQVIRAFPEYSFALVFIGSQPEDYGNAKYDLPDNVVHLETHYLCASQPAPQARKIPGNAEMLGKAEKMHDYFRKPGQHPEGLQLFFELARELGCNGRLAHDEFLYSQEAWEIVKRGYRRFCTDPSFVDYFWTVRSMHTPVWMLAEVAERFIPVRAYHTVSTGYAGLLGALLKQKTGRPLILSEHGIYTKERKIDLYHAQWIKDNRNIFQHDPGEIAYFRQLWIRFFQALGLICYEAADDIVALYEVNRQRQIEDGAIPERTQNIPNGIDIARFAPLREQRPAAIPPVMCLIGRVVPIKDVKTFIRAMRPVVNRLPGAQGWIAGPEDEDPAYAEECRNLVESLGLKDNVRFLGFRNMTELLPQIGLVVLSSISEALPLVILEGFAAGVPAVSTNVGSCRQLIYGLDEADRALGAAGRIVGIADPQALAEASLELLNDREAWAAASQAGIRRVEAYYTQDMMFAHYRALYQKALTWPESVSS